MCSFYKTVNMMRRLMIVLMYAVSGESIMEPIAKIVNGYIKNITKSTPFLNIGNVRLECIGNTHTCAATLIDRQWALTAAHCLTSKQNVASYNFKDYNDHHPCCIRTV